LAGAQVASIGVQRADLSELIVRRSVSIDAANAVVALERARQRVDAAQVEAQLAQRMLSAELRLLSAGESTLLQVNLRERFLAEALLRVAAARADQAIADVDVRWATGQL
ncbi:MAG: TolC family protein, partial [Candidatus Kapaibacteriota bacterium]